MNPLEFVTESEDESIAWGQKLGAAIAEPLLIFLKGTLGAGKTVFVKAVAAGLGINPEQVNSPTFTLMVPHDGRHKLVHVDAYRMADADEAQQLGLDDMIDDGCVMMIEWAERIATALPPNDLQIEIEERSPTARRFLLTANSELALGLLDRLNSKT